MAAAQVGHLVDNHFYDVDILLLVEAAYVICLAGDTIKILAENEVVLGTAQSHINIRKEGISATGDNIIMI